MTKKIEAKIPSLFLIERDMIRRGYTEKAIASVRARTGCRLEEARAAIARATSR